jgi:hypothetical protein
MCKESEQTTTQTTSVPGYIRKASRQLVGQASDLADKPFESYTGDRVADLSADQQSAFQAIRDLFAGGGGAPGARGYAEAPAQNISTERVVDEGGKLGAISDYMNPYIGQVVDTALRKIQEQSDQQRKAIGAHATLSGSFGDARHGVTESNLNRDTMTSMGDVAGNLYSRGFDQAMAERTGDINRFRDTDVTNANFSEEALKRLLTGSGEEQRRMLEQISTLLSGGREQQGNEQAGLDAAYQEFLRKYGHDFNVLDALSAAIGGARHNTTTTGTTPVQDNSLMQLAGGIGGSFLGTEAGASALTGLLAAI